MRLFLFVCVFFRESSTHAKILVFKTSRLRHGFASSRINSIDPELPQLFLDVGRRELHDVVVLGSQVHQNPTGVAELLGALRTDLAVAVAELVRHLLPEVGRLKWIRPLISSNETDNHCPSNCVWAALNGIGRGC